MKVKAKMELMHGGVIHKAGEEFEVVDSEVAPMMAAGYIEQKPVVRAAKKKTKKKTTKQEG